MTDNDYALATRHDEERTRAASTSNDDGTLTTYLQLASMHCGGCMKKIEHALTDQASVVKARANLSTKRVRITWDPDKGAATDLLSCLEAIGFEPEIADVSPASAANDGGEARRLLRSVGVAGFATANIMLLSVSVWSGAADSTRQLFHLLSGVIAVPAVAYAGQPFFQSAWRALRHRQLNMDVPISLAVTLATGMSVYESLRGGEHAYFDAATMLLFFLLIGRYLDHLMRERARGAVSRLSELGAKGAIVREADGTTAFCPIRDVCVGMTTVVAVGERFPVDGVVVAGESEIDRSIVTGESDSVSIGVGDHLEAGTVNLSGPIDVRCTKTPQNSFLAEVIQLMETAEQGKARYVRIADRVARIYAPVVHILAFATFAAWMIYAKNDFHTSMYAAISVLIITCPCALGLAVPIAQVVGAGRLFDKGVLIKDGAALERLTEVDTVIFDKTGTLTMGQPKVVRAPELSQQDAAVALSLAQASRHPKSRAVASYLRTRGITPCHGTLAQVREQAGDGISGMMGERCVRLGRQIWVQDASDEKQVKAPGGTSDVWFTSGEEPATFFSLDDILRPDARTTVDRLRNLSLKLEIVSGDQDKAVKLIAQRLAVTEYSSNQTPAEKIARIEKLSRAGRKVLMVGDGINDAPALAAAHASIAPSSGSDIGRQAADLVLTHETLSAIPFAMDIARLVDRIVRQNFGIAIAYNCIAVPLAMSGFVTPLVAAIAMSGSSLIVVANSLRLYCSSPRRNEHVALTSTQPPPTVPAVWSGAKAKQSTV